MSIEYLRGLQTQCEFHEPASLDRITLAEERLGVKFPDDLRSALCESDGVLGEYGLGLLWNVDRIEQDNLDFRRRPAFKELYMPFDHLLFIADAGNGDQFAYGIRANGHIDASDIFAWDHENDGRAWCASDLRNYMDWCISREL